MTRVSPELASAMIAKSRALRQGELDDIGLLMGEEPRLSAHESFEGHAPIALPLAEGREWSTPMNEEERAFSHHLDHRMANGDILRWWWQPWKFLLADRCSYTPDFVIFHLDRTIEVADVKAYWKASKKARAKNPDAKGKVHVEDDAKVKVKVAARMWPLFRWTYRYRLDGEWKSEVVLP